MDKSKGLLARACEGIMDLDRPACVKDGKLRHVAVNESYARFFDRPAQDFIDLSLSEAGIVLHDEEGEALREDKERRSLVFATEEAVTYIAPLTGMRHLARIERFSDEEGDLYLFCTFEEPVSAVATDDPGLDLLIDSGALDLIDVGISIYDRHNILIYRNETLRAFYAESGLVLRPGMALKDIIEHMYDVMASSCTDHDAGDATDSREAWVLRLLERYQEPFLETVQPLADGRWLRLINRRLDNGILIGLRIDVTQHVTQEAGLRDKLRETELLHAALEHLPVSVFMRDSRRRLTYANAAYERMMGQDRALFMGKTEQEMFPAATRFSRENDLVLQTGDPIEKDEYVPLSDGQQLSVITRLGRIITNEGENYIIGSIVDVSLLKARENDLETARGEAEKLHLYLESILTALPVGLLIFGADHRIEYVNSAYKCMWKELAAEPLVGASIREFMQINYRRGYYDHLGLDFEALYQMRLQALLSENNEAPMEFINSDGRIIVVTSKLLPEGRVLVTYVDITEIRQREQEASSARAELERVGQVMQDAARAMAQGLAVIEDGKFILTNDSLWQMLDMPRELCRTGEDWQKCLEFCALRGDFGTEEETGLVISTVKSNVEAGRPFSTSFHAAGKTWLHMESTPSARGHWLVVITDVTEMKQREAELTRLLTRAEAADRAKSEFLANMSHEIRTPMNGVLGMAELLAKSTLDTRQKTFTDIIVKSGSALLTIINDILDFSRIDAGQMKLRQAPFDPVEAIEDVVTLLSSPASEKDIELLVRSDAAIDRLVVGDAGRFRQIVTNLVGNAIKFTERGHVLIDISSEAAEEGEILLTLRVEDTGMGIPADRLGSIFDKFNQVDASSTRRHEGTGLGLAITAGLVSLFSGWLGVESEVGKGSAFTVRLPLRRSLRLPDSPRLPVSVRGAHVLVIDDSEINRDILTAQLSSWGFDCHAVEDGEAGMAMLEAASDMGIEVDAIILDSNMPRTGGIEIARLIRDDQRFDDVAIIFLTSMDMTADDSILTSLNVQGHLMKPVRAALLHTLLGDVIRIGRVSRGVELSAAGDFQDMTASAAQIAPSPVPTKHEPLPVRPATLPPVNVPSSEVRKTGLDVLVAEDNDVNQIVFTQILQSTGLKFRLVDNGQKAFDVWQAERPAVILMDVSMPVMNGHQATRAIREKEKAEGSGQHVPIVGVTAHALESDRELCFAAGMDDYLAKPISPELLEGKISRWLGREIPERNTTAG